MNGLVGSPSGVNAKLLRAEARLRRIRTFADSLPEGSRNELLGIIGPGYVNIEVPTPVELDASALNYAAIRRLILTGVLRCGDELPTYAQVRARGIYQSAWNQVLQELVADGLVYRDGSGRRVTVAYRRETFDYVLRGDE